MHMQTVMRPGITQSKAYTGTAGTIDNAITNGIRVVRVLCTTDAHIAVGKTPTATTSHMPVVANTYVDITVHPGEKVSAIQQSSGGTLYVTEMTQ